MTSAGDDDAFFIQDSDDNQYSIISIYTFSFAFLVVNVFGVVLYKLQIIYWILLQVLYTTQQLKANDRVIINLAVINCVANAVEELSRRRRREKCNASTNHESVK